MSSGRYDEEERRRRIGHNEAAFRRINEAARTGAGNGTSVTGILCECGHLDCREELALPRPEYEEVRSRPRRFIVLPGHEIPDAERVVAERDGWNVVEKLDAAGEVAEETDPRA